MINYNNNNNNNNNNKDDNKDNIILLGDSILANDYYVNDHNNSVCGLITKKFHNKYNVFCFAEDNAFIDDVYYQVDNLEKIIASTKTPSFGDATPNKNIIVLSIGGNNIIRLINDIYDNINNDINDGINDNINDDNVLKHLKIEYQKLISYIIKKFPNDILIITDIYYSYDSFYIKFKNLCINWNNFLREISLNYKNIILLPISTLLTEKTDFVKSIEPSVIGGYKIVDALSLYL